ncbi:hypothetical protein T459_26532 [Capsicum annuum]|uniref:Uncharacterized protein n=1 Tax=Capsicum annuum TaxID=4072 RepID=A0A2G2YNV8_CAPAN|nr:hypothetical protein T459_26532 [Capsicum annuum]
MRGVTELISKNIIQPVYDKCPFKKKAHSYKLQTLAYTAVTMLAEREKFIDFDEQGNPMREHSRSLRSCLVPQKDNKLENEAESSHGRNYNSNSRTTSSSKSGNSKPIMAHVVYNLNDVFLQLKREWFTEMKHVNIFYLGRWESTSQKHIEVEEPKDLEGLANLKYVKFLSLQGISGITGIPKSISKLWNLSVLDLRACQSLEVIPQGIGSLHNLTHLDLLECYLLSGMPKGLGELTNSLVLKGFEVQDSTEKSHSCTLEDLLAMTKLRKLSIHAEIEDFPRCSDLDVLAKFKQLRILTIEWGGNLFRNNPDSSTVSSVSKPGMLGITRTMTRTFTWRKVDEDVSPPSGVPLKLEKLDLKCYPRRSASTWLKPENLKELNRLYIRGGELLDLGQFEFEKVPTPWNNVKTLRLKYLTEMEMDWTEFRELFPEYISGALTRLVPLPSRIIRCGTQGGAVAYVFFPTVSRNKLWIPAVLIYVSGVIKYGEHIWALYLASLDRFRESIMKDPDPGPNYAKLMDEYSLKIAANLPTNIEIEGKEEKTDMKNREKTEKLQCNHSYSIQQNIYYKWSENIP